MAYAYLGKKRLKWVNEEGSLLRLCGEVKLFWLLCTRPDQYSYSRFRTFLAHSKDVHPTRAPLVSSETLGTKKGLLVYT